MKTRGPYLSSTEARRRMLESGAELARQQPPNDAFLHLRAVDVANAAGMSKSGVYRNFNTLEELHTAAMVEITNRDMEAVRTIIADDILALLPEGSDIEQTIHDMARGSFEAQLADATVDATVLLATLADNDEIASAARDAEQAEIDLMCSVYEAVDERMLGQGLLDGVDYEDFAIMSFALSDALVMWRNVDEDAVPLDLAGPEGNVPEGDWDPFSLGLWALYQHLRER